MVRTKATSSEAKPAAKKTTTKKKGAKAKKAPIKRTISDALIPIKDETWLIQPIAVTMMRYDYSLIQVRILVSIVENLQAILLGILNNKQRPQKVESTQNIPTFVMSIFHKIGLITNMLFSSLIVLLQNV